MASGPGCGFRVGLLEPGGQCDGSCLPSERRWPRGNLAVGPDCKVTGQRRGGGGRLVHSAAAGRCHPRGLSPRSWPLRISASVICPQAQVEWPGENPRILVSRVCPAIR